MGNKKEQQILTKEEWVDIYSIRANYYEVKPRCCNCGHINYVYVLKGIRLSGQEIKCQTCACDIVLLPQYPPAGLNKGKMSRLLCRYLDKHVVDTKVTSETGT